jgi:hypothetical protein
LFVPPASWFHDDGSTVKFLADNRQPLLHCNDLDQFRQGCETKGGGTPAAA